MSYDFKERKNIRMNAYMKTYGFKESTARKKATHDEILLSDLRTTAVVIRYYLVNHWVEVEITLEGYDELHEQSPSRPLLMVYEKDTGKKHPIPTDCWIQRKKRRRK